MPTNNRDLVPLTKRDDSTTKLKKQAAANALQEYSLLVLHSLKDNESPAKTRLKMMRLLTDIPADVTHYRRSNSHHSLSTE